MGQDIDSGSVDATAFFSILMLDKLQESIRSAGTPEEWEGIFRSLENSGPFAGAAAECPFFVVAPPTFQQNNSWSKFRSKDIDEATWNLLTQRGFMPLDRKLFERVTHNDLLEVTGSKATHPLVDLDYGLVLTPDGKMKNLTLDFGHLMRLQKIDAHYRRFPSAVFSVGALRARSLLDLGSPKPWIVPEIEINSRAELDDIIERLNEKISTTSAQIWFRGQTSDRLLDSGLSGQLLCPWRETPESSLVPSLYRNAWHGGELRPHAEKLLRIQKYVTFMQSYLKMQSFTTREPGGLRTEKLSPAWGYYAGGITANTIDSDNNILSSRDYHPAFNGIQRTFFLQHYGLPSNVLDITRDLDVSLYFAQNRALKDGSVVPLGDDAGSAVVYVFVLVPEIDRFLDSSVLAESYGLLRPERQKCGLLCGASFINRNHYARYIGLKLRLKKNIGYDRNITTSYIYPPREEDKFLDALLSFSERAGEELGDLLPFSPVV
ncbi:FRG domain-containing protein [Pseudomonas sp. SWI6]|uniref:FRG domain-containing protein n=1 Tax=Pseudomonas sp. SWI6 TaxID=2083051 RepID=UPI00131A157B|nr:FRG domain-containing protein [Pseudomonas sp. SWI6]